MRLISLVLMALLVLAQYPLWLGSGSWRRVWELDQQLAWAHADNAGRRLRNAGLEAEARELDSKGSNAIEERARYDLGMVRRDELFVQFNSSSAAGPEQGEGARQDAAAPAEVMSQTLPARARRWLPLAEAHAQVPLKAPLSSPGTAGAAVSP